MSKLEDNFSDEEDASELAAKITGFMAELDGLARVVLAREAWDKCPAVRHSVGFGVTRIRESVPLLINVRRIRRRCG